MKLIIIFAIIILILVAVITLLFKSYLCLKSKYKQLNREHEKLVNYEREVDEKINALHTGDSVSNALDVLSKH